MDLSEVENKHVSKQSLNFIYIYRRGKIKGDMVLGLNKKTKREIIKLCLSILELFSILALKS